MRRLFAIAVAAALLSATITMTALGAKPDPLRGYDTKPAVYHGALLKGGAGAAAADLALAFLKGKGTSAATIASLKVDSAYSSKGVSFVRFRQEVGGLRVVGAYVRAAASKGTLVQVISSVVDVRGSAAGTATTARQALNAALLKNHPALTQRPGVAARSGNSTFFAKTSAFSARPSAERVLLAHQSGALEKGWLVTTWTVRGNSLHQSIVDKGGKVAVAENLTASDQYRVFMEDPDKDPQTLENGAGTGTTESPSGWLSGGQRTINISGNNTHTYLDRDNDNQADAGGTRVTNAVFDATADFGLDPTASANQAVAVQNLFFQVNRVHDILYANGFTEATGNFQKDNFGLGGKGTDAVDAEAQDGGGFDNANFATPPDGNTPRMQMYLWTGVGGTHEVAVGSTTYDAVEMGFGPHLTTAGTSGGIQLVNDGVAGGTVNDGCEPLAKGSLTGKIALIDRGLCTFVTKVKNAQTAGAIGVIVALVAPGSPFAGAGPCGGCKIPAVMVDQAAGTALKALATDTSVTLRKKAVQPVALDGDLDTDVIFHEYGHGLTWRMIGHMSGTLSGAIGEGASDVLAFLINGDDVIGEYASPGGIRRAAYSGYSALRTYSDWIADEVHADGEIYAAAMWRTLELFRADGMTDSDLLATFVDGMNFTPESPAPEDMRDGMLASAAIHAPDQVCLIWNGFAELGIGLGASGKQGDDFKITESFVVPEECAA
jgi:hypothetical protein